MSRPQKTKKAKKTACKMPHAGTPEGALQVLHKSKMDYKAALRQPERYADKGEITANVGKNHPDYGKHPDVATKDKAKRQAAAVG